jgi:hypothetical protein
LLLVSLLAKALYGRNHLIFNMVWYLLTGAYMVTVSTLCGIVSIIGTPIIVFIGLLVLISAEFQSVRDMYKRLNGGRKISVVPVISCLASGLRSGLAGHSGGNLSEFADLMELMERHDDQEEGA